MSLRILVEPQQGATYEQVRVFAQHAESLGFEGVFTSDHYLRIGAGDPGPGPLDAWLLLAGLARDVPRLRLGSMMSPVSLRHPAVLALMAAQVDAMSGGRLEVGVGAGWYEEEHRALGVQLDPPSRRFDRLAEALEIITGVWRHPAGKTFDFASEHYRLADWPALPKPVQQPGPPLLLGGVGRRRTPALAARHADEFNVPFAPVAQAATAYERVRSECRSRLRPEASLALSAALVLCPGEGAALAARVEASGEPVDEINRMGAAGPVEMVAEAMNRYRAAGAQRLYAQVCDVTDLAHLDELAEAHRLAQQEMPTVPAHPQTSSRS
ncbi:TIGR03560 family F420-dependent LLM class oxidoreductase [Micromonospora sp. DT46]|uniref:TIGR03560 family F420-dependent LLM class oxidoreductase n=1 Tax=Micromonospora sp. DT46 TaxID=3393435 RepID=UPI003CE738DB